jgi:hypothetical protein
MTRQINARGLRYVYLDRFAWACALLTVSLLLGLALYLAPLEPNVLALQLTFTPRAFGQIVHTWTPEALGRYRAHFPADFALLLSYAGLGFSLATRLAFASGPPSPARWLLPLAAGCDALENLLHLWLTEVPRLEIFWPYPLAGALSTLKWFLILGFGTWVWVMVSRRWRAN